MAEVSVPPAAQALRRELAFVKSLLTAGRNIDEMKAAANAAARVAARAAEETKRSLHKGGTELTIRGLPSGGDWDWRPFKRWLQDVGMPQRSIRYTEKDAALDVGVVRFSTEADCSTAADLLPTANPPAAGCTITVERGLAAEYADKSRKREREGEGEAAGRGPKAARTPDVCEAVCPWWRVPYSQQLTDKHQRIVQALAAITTEVDRRTYGPSKPEWVRAARARAAAGIGGGGGPAAAAAAMGCCPLPGILRSPAIERYRNKSEFTAGLDAQEKPSVGFLRGAFQDGITCVGTPETTRHTSMTAIKLAAAAASYIRDVSEFDVYDKRKQEGYWRLVLVREGSHQSFLPVPLTATAAAAAAAAGDATAPSSLLDSPTFTSLDAFTYLVTFGHSAAVAAAVAEPAAAEPEAAEPAAAVEPTTAVAEAASASAEEKDVAMGAAEAAAAAGGEDGAAEATTAAAAATAAAVSSSLGGMDVSEVCEVEPERPPPDEVMVMLQVNPNYTRALAEPAAAASELRAMTAALAAAAAGVPLTTVRVQLHTGVSNAAPADAPLLELPAAAPEPAEPAAVTAAVSSAAGAGYIHDSLCELRFRISPTAFFQVNSPATCALYKVVGDWAAGGAKTLLLDICCGTGTIGLTMASRVSKVIGVDSVASAIEDARVNAALNGITNAEFVAGKAEDALPGILAAHAGADSPYGPGDVVAVADPPRAGLHRTVLRALLGCERIRRLVFVSCNPDNLVQNVAALCCPPDNRSGGGGGRGGRGRYSGGDRGDMSGYSGGYTPFRPVKALAVDLFPHTAHVEAVMLLER